MEDVSAPQPNDSTEIERSDTAEVVRRRIDLLGRLSGSSMLVTGAAGMIGRSIVRAVAHANGELLATPCHVIALDTAFQNELARPEPALGVEYRGGDVREKLNIDHADYIVHAASIASPPQYRSRPLETMETNFIGTRNVLDIMSRGARSAVVLSTSEVYGDAELGAIPTPETYIGRVNQYGPRACYVESKRLAETLCYEYAHKRRAPVRVVRPFNIYGPGQALDDGRIVPDIMRQLVQGKDVVLYSDGRSTRSLCYVVDAVEAILGVLLSDRVEGVYNVGNQVEEISIKRLAELAIEESGQKTMIRHERSPDIHYLIDNPTRRCPDIGRIRDHLGWSPSTDLRTGLSRTFAHYSTAATKDWSD